MFVVLFPVECTYVNKKSFEVINNMNMRDRDDFFPALKILNMRDVRSIGEVRSIGKEKKLV